MIKIWRNGMLYYESMQELIEAANNNRSTISKLTLTDQSLQMEKSEKDIWVEMEKRLKVMEESAQKGLESDTLSLSGLSGGDAKKMNQYRTSGKIVSGDWTGRIMEKALAVAEQNATMGKICAAPTAGSAGILPAVLLTVLEREEVDREKVISAMFTASAIGMVIAKKASLSGAEGGCQAECGSAAAMAAGALVEIMGGTPEMVGHACAFALKNVMGLVCDPVAGLVECPCVKRNVSGAVNAVISSDLALAGIESKIPVDEVIETMKKVGDQLPESLKETAKGGLADTKTGSIIKENILQ